MLASGRTAGAVVGAGTLLFGAAALLVASGPPAWDAALYRDLNEVPPDAAAFLTPLSRLCLLGGLSVVVVLALVYVVLRNRSLFPVAIGAGAALVALVAANLAKSVADRPRPYEAVAHAILRQQPAHGTSFPSSHTAVAFATVIALLPFVSRPVAVAAILYAALVGWSRIYVGVHYPLDVFGGAGIGIAVGGVALLVSRGVLRGPREDAIASDPGAHERRARPDP